MHISLIKNSLCRNTGTDSKVCLSELLCSMKDRVFPEEKVHGNGISDYERKRKILQLLNPPQKHQHTVLPAINVVFFQRST